MSIMKAGNQNKGLSILGKFIGKCCDSNVFNNNDMHLSRELFEKLIDSDEYKRAMENHHYLGFAGHPQDSDCQDFEHACIVMTDMKILDNGEIEGTFDLIDTPVGRIVKAFIDAGVKFGISIRGLGDVDGNGEVDPDQFIFRGFDLVTFPAYDDCIPEFKAIAASTDAKKQAQYKKICATIDTNLKDIKSADALELIKEVLPDDSEECMKIDDRIRELNDEVAEAVADADNEEAIAQAVAEQKLAAMTELYLEAKAQNRQLEQQVTDLSLNNQTLVVECNTLKQKQARFKKIVANQLEDANDTIDELEARSEDLEIKTKKLEAKSAHDARMLNKIQSSLKVNKEKLQAKDKQIAEIQSAYDAQVLANTRLKGRLHSLSDMRNSDKEAIKASKDLNLKYEHKIEANSEIISQKDSEIEELKSRLSETVAASKKLESKASNLDGEKEELLSRVEAAEEMVLSYQQAYADMYANALGVCLTGLPITANTSVEELKSMIKSGTSTASIPANPSFEEIEGEDYLESDLSDDDINYSAELVTM